MKGWQKFRTWLKNAVYKILYELGLIEPIYYIGNGESLPVPLTAEEEQELLKKIDEEGEEVRRILIERNLRLVVYIARKFENTGVLTEDLISIGTIGLIKAVNTFDPNKKIKLATYASRCIENEILMHLRAQKNVQKDVSLFEPIGVDKEGQSLQIRDILQLDEKPAIEKIEQKESFEQLYSYLNTLDPRELEIIIYRYGLNNEEPLTQKEIAKKLNISRSYVSRIEKRALVKLYQQFKHNQNEREREREKKLKD